MPQRPQRPEAVWRPSPSGARSSKAGKSCTVYLPDGYDRDTTRRYPVLYLLHGASGYHGDWVEKGNMYQIAEEAIAAGRALPMVVVMPDASGTGPHYMGDHMGYFDVPGWAYERFFFEEFLPAVEQRYRIRGDKRHRAIAGLSMGAAAVRPYMPSGIRSSSRRPAR